MKKLILSLLAVAATLNVLATPNVEVKITLTSSSSYSSYVMIAQDPSLDAPEVMPMYMVGRPIAFYAKGAEEEQYYASNNLGELAFGLMTNADVNYTLTISDVTGTETLSLKDEVTGDVIALTNGTTYNFTAEPNTTNETRFHLYIAPSAPSICHQYGKLAITGHNGETVSIKEMDGSATSIEDRTLTEDYVEIDLAALNGKYRVTVGTETFVINTNPTVVPENN